MKAKNPVPRDVQTQGAFISEKIRSFDKKLCTPLDTKRSSVENTYLPLRKVVNTFEKVFYLNPLVGLTTESASV